MTEIIVTLYKPNGKFYGEGRVTVELPFWDSCFKGQLDNEQTIVGGRIFENYHVQIQDTPENMADPEYLGFYNHLFPLKPTD